MRQLGVRVGIPLVIALIATVGVLGGAASAWSHHHHRGHHHGGGGGAGATPPSEAAPICTASPNPALITLTGRAVAVSVSCHGLSPAEPAITVDSLAIRGNCFTATNLPLGPIKADLGGNASFNIVGTGCLPGTYGVQLVGFFTTTEFPVTFTF